MQPHFLLPADAVSAEEETLETGQLVHLRLPKEREKKKRDEEE